MHIIPQEEVKKVKWKGDIFRYDCALHALGRGKHERFVVITPDTDYHNYHHFIDDFDYKTEKRCIVWMYDDHWIAKLFPKNWEAGCYATIEIELPKIKWKRNPKITKSIKFENDPTSIFEPAAWDTRYDLIWYTAIKDENNSEVWAVRCYPENKKSQGAKHMGYLNMILPNLIWERNPSIPESIKFENDPSINYKVSPWDIGRKYEMVWHIDSQFSEFVTEKVWVFKCYEKNKKFKKVKHMGELTPITEKENIKTIGIKDMGEVTPIMPEIVWERNPNLSKSIKFENDPSVNYKFDIWDADYELIWYVDSKFMTDEVWLSKCHVKDVETNGVKNMGEVTPIMPETVWERNPSIPESIKFENDPSVNYKFDIWDADYELVWCVDSKFSKTNTWVFKCYMENVEITGTKIVGEVTPILTEHDLKYERNFQLDVIFISYYEANAEQNWNRVLEKAPWAQRVDGVEGIFNAHKAASKLATTDMFYVVDGDAWLVDDFNFNFQPNIFDRECTHIWRARNPISKIAYGYGGVKLFSKQIVDDATSWTTLDMATTIGSKLKIVNKISNITAFNTDEFSTWRGSFRECVKLCYNTHLNINDKESIYRLEAWMSPSNQPFAQYAIDAAHKAKEWVQQNINDMDILRQINDRKWLEQEFNRTYNDN